MGRMEQFKQLLGELKLSDEDKQALEAMVDRTPEVADAMLRQADYDRNMNQLKAKHTELTTWYDDNKTAFETAQTEAQRAKELEAQLAEIRSGKDVDMTAEQLTAAVAAELEKRGISNPTDAQIQALAGTIVDSKVKETATALEDKFLKETFPQHMDFMFSVTDKMLDYQTEFGKKLDRADFIGFCQRSGKATVDEAYQEYVKSVRSDKQHAEDLEKARREERERLQNQNLPGSTAPVAINEPGPVLLHMKAQAEAVQAAAAAAAAAQAGGRIGDGSAAASAAAALRAAGKV